VRVPSTNIFNPRKKGKKEKRNMTLLILPRQEARGEGGLKGKGSVWTLTAYLI